MRSGWRAALGASIGLGLLAACGAFSGGDDDDVKPDAGSTSGIASDGGGSSSGQSSSGQSSSGQSSSSSSGQSSSSGVINCLRPTCPANTFCDEFTRAMPAENGWTYAGTGSQVSQDFHIAHDAGDPCMGALFAYTGTPGLDAGISRIIGRPVAAPNQTVNIEVDFAYDGNSPAISGSARAAFIIVTPSTKLDLDQPYIGLSMKDGKLGLIGRGTSAPAQSTDTFLLMAPGENHRVTMQLSTNGGVSSLTIADVAGKAEKALPSLDANGGLFLFVGTAIANAGVPGGSGLGVHFDNLSVETP